MKWEWETGLLVQVDDHLWVSLHDVAALQHHFGGTRIHLRHNHAVQTDLSVDEVMDRLRGAGKALDRG